MRSSIRRSGERYPKASPRDGGALGLALEHIGPLLRFRVLGGDGVFHPLRHGWHGGGTDLRRLALHRVFSASEMMSATSATKATSMSCFGRLHATSKIVRANCTASLSATRCAMLAPFTSWRINALWGAGRTSDPFSETSLPAVGRTSNGDVLRSHVGHFATSVGDSNLAPHAQCQRIGPRTRRVVIPPN